MADLTSWIYYVRVHWTYRRIFQILACPDTTRTQEGDDTTNHTRTPPTPRVKMPVFGALSNRSMMRSEYGRKGSSGGC